MNNSLEIFKNAEFGEIRTAEIDGKPYVVGVDVARALDYANPSKAVINHCRGITKLGMTHLQTNQHGYSGETIRETNMIPESDIYRLIIKAAEQSKNPEIKAKAERFEKWIFEEVLPSIRKHGAYITTDKMEELMSDPDTWVKLIRTLQQERREKAELQNQIEKNKPKVIFSDAVCASDCNILVGEMAKILKGNGIDIGQNRLFERLRNEGFLVRRKGSDKNLPTQKSMNLGLFRVTENAITHSDGHVTIIKTAKITGKGQVYFTKYFLTKKDNDHE